MEGFGSSPSRLKCLEAELNECIRKIDKCKHILVRPEFNNVTMPSSYNNKGEDYEWMLELSKRQLRYHIIMQEKSDLISKRNRLLTETRIETINECDTHIIANYGSSYEKCVCCLLTNFTGAEDYLSYPDKIKLIPLLENDKKLILPEDLPFEEAIEIYRDVLSEAAIAINDIEEINKWKQEIFDLIVLAWELRKKQEQMVKKIGK